MDEEFDPTPSQEQPFFTYAMFEETCPLCNAVIPQGEECYLIPAKNQYLCSECGEKAANKPLCKDQLSLF